ncbi:DivIVA domain-containing protein [Micromonospora sp. SL1-18]|uniref:DivIVA domain-containing protein n=1 Tax=Micromonospora sp. SL1-18 TaxID=3399128 RepID=UPI003A4DC793
MANLTPADVRNVAFRKPPLGKRGYDEWEVDKFLDAVEQTITALTEEVRSLRAQLGHGSSESGTDTPSGGPGAVSNELEQMKERLSRLEATVANAGLRAPAADPLFGGR